MVKRKENGNLRDVEAFATEVVGAPFMTRYALLVQTYSLMVRAWLLDSGIAAAALGGGSYGVERLHVEIEAFGGTLARLVTAAMERQGGGS